MSALTFDPWAWRPAATLAKALLTLSAQLQDANRRIAFLEKALSAARAAMPADIGSDPKPAPETDVDRVIDQLDKRLVGDSDRGRLRKSLDTADKPLGGRAGADEALGRAIRWGR